MSKGKSEPERTDWSGIHNILGMFLGHSSNLKSSACFRERREKREMKILVHPQPILISGERLANWTSHLKKVLSTVLKVLLANTNQNVVPNVLDRYSVK